MYLFSASKIFNELLVSFAEHSVISNYTVTVELFDSEKNIYLEKCHNCLVICQPLFAFFTCSFQVSPKRASTATRPRVLRDEDSDDD